jgi:predicted GIY-YIG superfamily endonuclease
MCNGLTIIGFDDFGAAPPEPSNLSPSRVWQCREGEPSGVSAGRGSSSTRIIASVPPRFHRVKSLPRLSCTTTKMPGLLERERPKHLPRGRFGFLSLALGLPVLKHGAALSKPKGMGGGGACDSGFWFLSEASPLNYVYMIKRHKDGAVKIGVSKDPESRLKDLMTGSNSELALIAKFPFSSRAQAFEVEKWFHRMNQRFRQKGEWFNYGAITAMRAREKDDKHFKFLMATNKVQPQDIEAHKWARDFL